MDTMKIITFALLAVLASLLVCGCSGDEDGREETTPTPVITEAVKRTSVYTDGSTLSSVKEITSPDGKMIAVLFGDESNRYFYSVYYNDVCVIEPSRLGLVTEGVDFSVGAEYTEGTVSEITDTYTLLNGKHQGQITDSCNQYSFPLNKDGETLTVNIRVYDDGVAYNYTMQAGAVVEKEVSESVFADDAMLWSYSQPNVTYEGSYRKYTMEAVRGMDILLTVPTLVRSGEMWTLITEASVFDDEDSYCSSYLKSNADSKNLYWTFGNGQTGSVTMEGAFETPWRVAVIGNDLDIIVNSDIVTSVCNDAENLDYGFVKPGKLAWSWWSSTGDDPIAYDPQFAYIDFAAENGWEYVCLDYGWVLWDDYKAKVKELSDYAAEKGVGLWLWYGVNNVGHSATGAYPKYSLLDEETIRMEMEWAQSLGIKGVKVDYYEKDDQTTMNQMYLCAKIAAENELMVLFHGCTNPGGENRTFPNVLSYEAIYGAEYYKWRTEPSVATIITALFTRNAVGSADFTPTALPVAGITASYGFMLGTTIYIESGLVHFAENVNVYEGYGGLSLMNDMPVTWDETKVLEGMPGEYGTVARRAENDWYIASLTRLERTAQVELSFLESGKEYTAYIYKTNSENSNIEVITQKVTYEDVISVELTPYDGFAVKVTAEEFDPVTDYEKNYAYFEAETATLGGAAKMATSSFSAQYSSGQQVVEYVGNGAENSVSFAVSVDAEGVYELNIYYISAVNRRFMVSINGDDANRVRTKNLKSGDWVTVNKETIYVALAAGENIIKFYNDKAYAPNLDRIAISTTTVDIAPTVSDEQEDVTVQSPGAEYTYTHYEAENAVIAEGATKENTLVGWIGGNAYVLFDKVEVAEAGTYYLQIWYMSGEDRAVAISVNGSADMVVECPSSGDYYSNPACVYTKVELNAGINTIKVWNPNGYAPNLDKIGVSVTAE